MNLKTVADMTNTVGVSDLSDAEVEDVSYVGHDRLQHALDVAESLGLYEFEIGVTYGKRDPDEEPNPVIVLRDSEDADAGIVIAPRLREGPP